MVDAGLPAVLNGNPRLTLFGNQSMAKIWFPAGQLRLPSHWPVDVLSAWTAQRLESKSRAGAYCRNRGITLEVPTNATGPQKHRPLVHPGSFATAVKRPSEILPSSP